MSDIAMDTKLNAAVVGAGAWGTAFALHLARLGHRVVLVPRREEHAAALRAERENRDYLPGLPLPETLCVDADEGRALAGVQLVLVACPSHSLAETCAKLRARLPREGGPWVVSLTKGLENTRYLRPSQILCEELPGARVAALAGPTNAAEVARGQPAAMVLASEQAEAELRGLQAALSGPTLRVYTSTDVAGVEYGGCLKNIYAIAAGCCDGLRLGDNAKAALLTRALAEMVRVGTALGARAETFYGLGGFGDMVATCHGAWSRNREFGQRIGEGARVADLLGARKSVVEGYRTVQSFAGLCQVRGLEAPILQEVYRLCYEGRNPRDTLLSLMTRELKRESL
jgi:glycerol-3-phosphate dehydrogenase (NAD(P)+)